MPEVIKGSAYYIYLVRLHIGLEALEVQFVCSDGVVAQPTFQLQVSMVLAVNHR